MCLSCLYLSPCVSVVPLYASRASLCVFCVSSLSLSCVPLCVYVRQFSLPPSPPLMQTNVSNHTYMWYVSDFSTQARELRETEQGLKAALSFTAGTVGCICGCMCVCVCVCMCVSRSKRGPQLHSRYRRPHMWMCVCVRVCMYVCMCVYQGLKAALSFTAGTVGRKCRCASVRHLCGWINSLYKSTMCMCVCVYTYVSVYTLYVCG